MENVVRTRKNVLITGATGMVGSQVLALLLEDPTVNTVLSLGRRELGLAHKKLTEIVCPDFNDLSHLEGQLGDIDICFHCLGVYQNQVSRDKFFEITCDYQESLTDILEKESPDLTFVLFGASGADPSGESRATFRRGKGKAEAQLWKTCFPQKYIFRAGHIHPTGDRLPYGEIYKASLPLLERLLQFFPNQGSTDAELARAMVVVGLSGKADCGIFESRHTRRVIDSKFQEPFLSDAFPLQKDGSRQKTGARNLKLAIGLLVVLALLFIASAWTIMGQTLAVELLYMKLTVAVNESLSLPLQAEGFRGFNSCAQEAHIDRFEFRRPSARLTQFLKDLGWSGMICGGKAHTMVSTLASSSSGCARAASDESIAPEAFTEEEQSYIQVLDDPEYDVTATV
jgi:nucleoside-diphosphate-sugar epimerase